MTPPPADAAAGPAARPEIAREDQHAVLRGAGVAGLGFLVRPLSRLPFLLIVGRLYGEGPFGAYVFAVGVIEALAAFSRLGFKDTLFQFLADPERSLGATLVEAVLAVAGLASACAVVVALDAPWIGAITHKPTLWATLGAMAPVLPVFVCTDVLFAATRFHRSLRYEAFGRSVAEPAVLTLASLALGVSGLGPAGLVVAYMAAQVGALAVAAWGTLRLYRGERLLRARLDPGRMAHMARRSAPTGLADCLTMVFNAVEILVVGSLLGASAAGLYGMAQTLVTVVTKVRQAFDLIVLPVVSRGLVERGQAYVVEQLRAITRWIVCAQAPLLLLAVFLGTKALGWIGKGFEAAGPVLALLAVAGVLDGALNLAQAPLLLRRPKLNFAIAAVALAVHLPLAFGLVHLFGSMGAPLSLAITLTTTGALRQAATARSYGHGLLTASLLKPLIAGGGGAVCGALVLRVLPGSGVAATGAALAAYAAGLWALKLEPADRLLVRSLLSRSRLHEG